MSKTHYLKYLYLTTKLTKFLHIQHWYYEKGKYFAPTDSSVGANGQSVAENQYLCLLKNMEMRLPEERILILDGAMGTMIQRYGLTEEDYRSGVFQACSKELRGNNECLNLTHPEIIKSIHKEYIAAGADIIETNTFSANRISQAEYGCEDYAARMAYEGARHAREVADEYLEQGGRRILVAGSMGPTSKSLSLSPDVSDPGFRPYSFDQMREAYRLNKEILEQSGKHYHLAFNYIDKEMQDYRLIDKAMQKALKRLAIEE